MIEFRNGVRIELTWADYCRMRDWFRKLHRESVKIEKTNEGYCFKGEKPNFSFSTPSLKETNRVWLDLVLSLVFQGWTVEQIDNDNFRIRKDSTDYVISKIGEDLFKAKSAKVEMEGPIDALNTFFCECGSGVYDCDCSNKIVLDVGGFCGETALFFHIQGAKKVIIYEPVLAHHEFIRRNIKLNKIEAELYEEGIGEEDGDKTINYDSANLAFGLPSKGKNQLTIKIKNITNVLEESNADIAKIDCEGAERSLVKVPDEVLRKIRIYIIETHTQQIEKAIMAKFTKAGFKLTKRSQELQKNVAILHLYRAPNSSEKQ
jgi:FkbM family methyltransferase